MNTHKIPMFFLLFISLFCGLFLLSYVPHYSFPWFIVFSLILFYPFLRLIIDASLLIASLKQDETVRYIISILTNNKVPIHRPWKERYQGIFRWLFIYWSILSIEFIIYLFLIRRSYEFI